VSVAAPVGPLGVLTIRRTLAHGRLAGFVTGLGVATADGLYSIVAAFSLSFIANTLIGIQTPVRLIGGIFLLYLGIKTLLAKPAENAAAAGGTGLLGMYGSALALTITNPMTIIAFAGIFVGAGLELGGEGASPLLPLVVVIGVFSGSALWWFTLTSVVNVLRGRFTPRVMQWVNRISGAVIIAFALNTLAGLISG
jgi:threonine/homoserine/homoserine lactone efflux protein